MPCYAVGESTTVARSASERFAPQFHSSASGHCRARRLVSLLLLTLVCGCSGCRTEPAVPPHRTESSTTDSVSQTPDISSPANVPSPFALPAPKPMTEDVVKKYFLFPADKPIIPYTKAGPFAGNFFVDPNSGKLAWKAMVCTATDCPGRKPDKPPERFAMRHVNLYPLPDGTTPNMMSDGAGPQACPYCGRSQTITEYLSPADESRKTRLAAELQQAYTQRAAARAAGRQAAEGVRTPQEVMDEINSIPRHYLLDKDMDYAPLEAAGQSPPELADP